MSNTETITLTPDMEVSFWSLVQENGLACVLTRWYCEYEARWFTAVSIREGDTGREVLHSGMSNVPFTMEAAIEQARNASDLIKAVNKETADAE